MRGKKGYLAGRTALLAVLWGRLVAVSLLTDDGS
jgi:hypothetical protein